MVTEIQKFRSNQLMQKKSIILNLVRLKKMLAFLKEDHSLKITVPLSMSNSSELKNGFKIRDLHHFASKNVPHTISQILKVTEIQQIRSNQLMLKNR